MSENRRETCGFRRLAKLKKHVHEYFRIMLQIAGWERFFSLMKPLGRENRIIRHKNRPQPKKNSTGRPCYWQGSDIGAISVFP